MGWEFSEDGAVVERECLLFEAGEYPDKGVTITADDLRAIAANSGESIPMKIEHLPESPFDKALGVVTRLRAAGSQLWGTLRQPVEAWQFVQRAGSRSLSVALDVAGRRVLEASFVRHPRVANAQVFCDTNVVEFRTAGIFAEERGGMGAMNVRQFAEGLITYLRGVLGSEESEESSARFAAELAAERESLREERAAQRILEWKRLGRLRATERAEQLARTLLTQGEESVARFDGASVSLGTLFAQFVQENGPVVPMGEVIPADKRLALGQGRLASERLMALTQERARQEGVSYVQAFAAVTAANPELAQAAREE